jgi:hypothetical protein
LHQSTRGWIAWHFWHENCPSLRNSLRRLITIGLLSDGRLFFGSGPFCRSSLVFMIAVIPPELLAGVCATWHSGSAQICLGEIRLRQIGHQARSMQVGSPQVGSPQVGRIQVRFMQVRPVQISPVQVGINEYRLMQICPMQIGLSQDRCMEVRFMQVRSMQISPTKIDLSQACPVQVDPVQVGSHEILLAPFQSLL